MKKYVLLFTICLFFLSCGDDDVDCSLAIPPPNNVLFQLQDPQGNLLIGTTFLQDSFKLFNPSSTVYLKPVTSFSGTLSISFPDIESSDTYFLELSSTDTDTLSLDFNTTPSDCFTSYSLNSFIYNNLVIYDENAPSSSVYTIIKE